MVTKCYAQVRGSAIRVTGLTKRGDIPASFSYAVSKSVTKVSIDEVTQAGGNEMIRNQYESRRLMLATPTQSIRYNVAVNFLRVDPGLLNLVAGVPVLTNAGGDIVGFDSKTRLPAASFALEVWSQLTGPACHQPGFGEMAFGVDPFGDHGYGQIANAERWGYTLFPFLKGGLLDGFIFRDGLVSFTLRGARTQRLSNWGTGPYWLDNWCPMPTAVSGNTHFRNTITSMHPPLETDGAVVWADEIDGGTASMTSPDELDGGNAFEAGPCEIDGGAA